MSGSAHQLLASPTLVRLYLSQGHLRRALELCTSLCELSPRSGTLLALRARIERLGGPRLSIARGGDGHVIRWSGLDNPASLVVCAQLSGPGVHFTSIPLATPSGTVIRQHGVVWLDDGGVPSPELAVEASSAGNRERREAISVCIAREGERGLCVLATACSDIERSAALASGAELG